MEEKIDEIRIPFSIYGNPIKLGEKVRELKKEYQCDLILIGGEKTVLYLHNCKKQPPKSIK